MENKIESGFLNEIVYNFRSNLLILNSVQNRMVEVCAHVKLICQHVLKETFFAGHGYQSRFDCSRVVPRKKRFSYCFNQKIVLNVFRYD